jgi:hypothetical protein
VHGAGLTVTKQNVFLVLRLKREEDFLLKKQLAANHIFVLI